MCVDNHCEFLPALIADFEHRPQGPCDCTCAVASFPKNCLYSAMRVMEHSNKKSHSFIPSPLEWLQATKSLRPLAYMAVQYVQQYV